MLYARLTMLGFASISEAALAVLVSVSVISEGSNFPAVSESPLSALGAPAETVAGPGHGSDGTVIFTEYLLWT